MKAAEILTNEPQATLRSVASRVGTSQATVLDVRRRLARGDDPVPSRFRSGHGDRPSIADDAALSSSNDGGELTAWFAKTDVTDDCERYAIEVPLSRVYLVADEARRRARYWVHFADLVEARAHRR